MKREHENFEHKVRLKYNIYNSIFQNLGLDGIYKTGILLPLFSDYCRERLDEGVDPRSIVESFFEKNEGFKNDEDRLNMLFRFIQFIERQVVLVDSLEDAAFGDINDLNGGGSVKAFYETLKNRQLLPALKEAMKDFKVRTVLTAHPTQFYPGPVLGIIKDLAEAVKHNKLGQIETLLAQLGYTPFFKKTKPTPFDEAVSLVWFLENLFYNSIPAIYEDLAQNLDWSMEEMREYSKMFQLGFWPGGDRDGNPYVNTEVTLRVADRLRESVFRCYYRDIRLLKRKISFSEVEDILSKIEAVIYDSAFRGTEQPEVSEKWIDDQLVSMIGIIDKKYGGLYRSEVNKFRLKLNTFGFHFASIDIRQDNDVLRQSFDTLIDMNKWIEKKFEKDTLDDYFQFEGEASNIDIEDPIIEDTLDTFNVIKKITERNGPLGSYRYIISNCNSSRSVGRVYMMSRLMGWEGPADLDIVPLFETIDDLQRASATMEELYTSKPYRAHLEQRENKQVIMLGFSDGTKDGGYLTANWSIYKAKEEITAMSRKYGVKAVFFDGRGGPPARGGGNTHRFYASLGKNIESNEIQLTIQGQTISSNFGTEQSSRFNLEQLFTAGLENIIFDDEDKNLDEGERKLMEELSEISRKVYLDFKNDPLFISYLEERSTLTFYAKANIGSRPSKRGKTSKLTLKDLRAIPFVGAWSQLKQNVPGFYGWGSTLKKIEEEGRLKDVEELYRSSLFFRTLVGNSMQSLCKSFFPLTQYMKYDPVYGGFWSSIYEEYKLTVDYLLKISGEKQLMEGNRSIRESIRLRESIVLPLLVIQQYALMEINNAADKNDERSQILEKLVIRSLYGNINASRNSA